jgi:hypothetical protein
MNCIDTICANTTTCESGGICANGGIKANLPSAAKGSAGVYGGICAGGHCAQLSGHQAELTAGPFPDHSSAGAQSLDLAPVDFTAG